MRKSFISIFISALFAFSCLTLQASPAYPNPITVKQADGSLVTIQLHGDEYRHWTTINGNIVEKDTKGIYHNVKTIKQDKLLSYSSGEKLSSVSSSIRKGNNHFLVLLIEFSDLSFTVTDANTAFSNLLNQEGYSANGATGSVHDYYYENSSHVFNPTYDVIGPIKVANTMAYYGNNDNPHYTNLVIEACTILDNQGFDFSQYDIDEDGFIDSIFYYFAGHNEAEGGGDDTIWPHAWRGLKVKSFDGKFINSYACSSEYKGASGNNMCGIGTFCHEFGHVLGLPDLYDTDYDDNGRSNGLYNISLMSSGNYNNQGRTPPYLSGMERYLLEWMEFPIEWTSEGEKTINSVDNNEAYHTKTDNDGEVFVYEVRKGTGWDAYIGSGLLIYHVDRSSNVIDGMTATYRWSQRSGINAYADHPCCYIKEASSSYTSKYSNIFFPGSKNVTSFDAENSPYFKSWAGEDTGFSISDISYSSGVATLKLNKVIMERKLIGTILDTSDSAVSDATITVTDVESVSCTTAEDGTFELSIPSDFGEELTVRVTATGYINYAEKITLSSGAKTLNVVLKMTSFNKYGFTAIDNPKAGASYKAGESFKLQLVKSSHETSSVKWYMDDAAVNNDSVTLSAGEHLIKASVTYKDGNTEDIELTVKVD